MKVLLDENIPHDVRHLLPGHDAYTVTYMGWSSFENGDLLRLAADNGFDVVLTKDSGVQYEQHLPNIPIAIIILKAKTNKLEDIRPLLPEVLRVLSHLKPKTVTRVQ